jgi:hypothetical protein
MLKRYVIRQKCNLRYRYNAFGADLCTQCIPTVILFGKEKLNKDIL